MTLQLYNPDEVRSSPLLDLGPAPESHSEEFVGTQSAKMHVAMGDKSPGIQELSSSMSTGNDERYRQLLADSETIRRYEVQSDALSSVLQTATAGSVTPELVNVVQGLSEMEMRSPDIDSIVEKKYAQKFANTAAASLENGVMEDAVKSDPEGTLDAVDRLDLYAFKQNYIAKKLDSAKQDIDSQNWNVTVGNFLENVFVGEYQQMDQVGTDVSDTSILPGTDRLDQYAFLYAIEDQDEFTAAVNAAVDDLKSRNPYSLQQWLEGFYSYGNLDSTINNVFAISDVAGLTPLGILKKAFAGGAAKAVVKSPLNIPEIAADLGKNADAAVGMSVEDLAKGDFFRQNIRHMDELEKSVPSIASPLTLLKNSQNLSQASMLRLKEALQSRADLVQKFLLEPNLVERSTPEELIQYKDILLDDYVKANPTIQKNVIDVAIEGADVGNVYQAKISIGKRDGTLFESAKQAENYFKRYIGGTNDYRVAQRGEGFTIELTKNVDESRIATDIRLGTTQRTPESLANTMGGFLRSSDYLVSKEAGLQRGVVVSSKEFMDDVFSEIAKPFGEIDSKELDELQDLMVDNRVKQEYFNDYGEFESAFFRRFKKPPTEKQTDAYFAYVQVNDLDLVVRDLDWYKQKARLGIEEVSFKVGTDTFTNEAKVVSTLPYGSSDYFTVSILKDGKAGKPVGSPFLNETKRSEIGKLLEEGYVILQGADPFKIGDDMSTFVVVKDVQRNRIGVKNVDRKPGGHKVHKYPFYIKQGRFSSNDVFNLYTGDTTLFNIRSSKEGAEVVKLLEQARLKVLNKEADASTFIRDNLPMIGLKRWNAAVKSGLINLDVPFTMTKSGQRGLDTGAYSSLKNIKDVQRNEHNLSSKITGKFGGERSEADLQVIRSEGDVKFEIEGAPYLSPLETLSASSGNMLSTRLMNDHTISTLSNFKREFGDILAGTREEIDAAGIDFLLNPSFKAGVDPSRVAAAQNVSRAYQNLMNIGTDLDRKVEFYKEKLIGNILPKFGPRGQQWLEDRMLSKTKDPGNYLRSFAFNTKLGLFNIQQLFIQANGAVNIASIAGTNGLRGISMYPMIRAAMLTKDEGVLQRLAKVADSTGLMKAKEFDESIRMLKRSGWNNLGGDIAYLDDIKSPEIRKGSIHQAGSTILKWGRTPFNEGERAIRLAAWQAAYLERKALLRGKAISRRDEAMILQRAKDLTGNMTRESNASWQKGYSAVATQFFGYQARIMEQFLGKKLTSAEKIRLFAGYSFMYGVPVATGAVAGVIPVRDILRDTLAQSGIDVDDTMWEPLMDGMAQSMIEYLTDFEPAISGRYGPGGLPTFYDMWRGDKDFSDIFLGAGGSIALETIASSYPPARAMLSEIYDYEGGLYNLQAQDFLDPLRNISSVDNAVKLYNVYNFQVWASKSGADITEMDLPEGILATMTGLQPARIEDGFTAKRAEKAWKEQKEDAIKSFTKETRKMMKMEQGPERERVIRQLKARMVLEGLSMKERARVWKYAASDEMMIDVFFEQYEKALQDRQRNEEQE